MASPEQDAVYIKQRIAELEEMSDEDLKSAMSDLKRALKENPSAVAIMLPEDVGLMVRALRRITGEAVEAAAKKKTSKTKAPKVDLKRMTKEEVDALIDEM